MMTLGKASGSVALLVSWCLISGLSGCGSAALKSNEIRFTLQESPVLVKENGTVIVNKRQVAEVRPDGKVVDTRGRPLAWLYGKNIRLRGGVTLEIRQDAEGTVYLSKTALDKAGLRPMPYRVRKNGTMASTENARGVDVSGAHVDRNRHIVLLLLVLDTNGMWPTAE